MSDLEPDLSAELDAEGIPDLEGSPPGVTIEDVQEGLTPPRDFPLAVEEYGITNAEQRVPESVADRVWREEPEVKPGELDDGLDVSLAADEEVGRIVEADLGGVDVTAEEVGFGVEDEGVALSAEEAAMHLTDPPPMGDGDGYIDDDGTGPA